MHKVRNLKVNTEETTLQKDQKEKINRVKKVKFSNLWKTKKCLSSLSTMSLRFNAEEINLNCIFDRTVVRTTFHPFVSIENNLWENLIEHQIGWFCKTKYLICLFQLQLFFLFYAAGNVAEMSASEENVKRGIPRIWGRFLSLIIKNSFTARYMVQVFVALKIKLCTKVSRHHKKPY